MSRGRKPRAGRPEPSREQLMAAAIDCFARLGYQGTTIDRIARDAGVTKGAVYYHFRDKEELLFEAVKDRIGGFEQHVLEKVKVTPAPDALTRLREVVDACFFHATVSNHRRFIMTLMIEALDTNPRLSAEFRDILRRMRTFLTTVVQRGWELGLVQSSIPEAFGGYGDARSAVTSALILEELAYGDLALALHLVAPRLLTIPLLVTGTEEQRKRWLPRFAEPEFTVGTAAFVEPRWDFDATSLATRAERQGGGYVLTGQKCLVPLAARAEAVLVYAAAPDGLAAFVVERGAPGLTVGEREKNMGIKALDTHPLTLEGVRVPAAARLGGEGANLQPLVDASRIAVAALAVGVARAAFDYARDYAKEPRAFGVAIAQKQAIAFKLADMAIEIDSMRLLTWEAAWKLDSGRPATREAVLVKQYGSQSALNITDNAVQVLGGHGYIREHPVELWLRNARGLATFDGLAVV